MSKQLSEAETTAILDLTQVVSTESDDTVEIETLQLNGQESAVDVAPEFDDNGDTADSATEESYEFDDVPF